MFVKAALLLTVLAGIAQAAPLQMRAEGSGTNVNLVSGSTPVFDNKDGTFHVDMTNGDNTGTFGLTLGDKTFALNIACLNDAATKCGLSDEACKDKARKACTQGNKIGSVTAPLNADKPSAATKVDTDPAAIANNENGTPLITGDTPREIGGGFTGALDDGQGNFNSFIETPIRAIALQIGCLVDEIKCQGGEFKEFNIGTGDCTKDRIDCEDFSGLTGLSVKMNND